MSKCINHDWHGLYGERWGDDLVPDAYAHPAKVSRGLARRIYRHLLDQGYIQPGDTIIDPFAGIGGFALDAMRIGCHFIGSELESKFVMLGSQNIDRWNARYRGLWPDTWGTARIFQGDSRELGKVLREAGGLVSSPPYAGALGNARDYTDDAKARADAQRDIMRVGAGKAHDCRYSTHPSNLGNMWADQAGLDAAISSPPWLDERAQTGRNHAAFDIGCRNVNEYGHSPGQLAAMPEGQHDAVVSSPPYQGKRDDGGMIPGHMRAPGGKSQYRSGAYYGSSSGQLASMEGDFDERGWISSRDCTMADHYGNDGLSTSGQGRAEGLDDFWTAARAIVDQCYLVLKPGAAAVWVVKRFVRNKEIVNFPDQWRQMCEAAGFETVEWIRAWLVEDRGTQIDLFGNDHEQRVERKSFFRRLAESKGSPRIDYEDVLIMQKSGGFHSEH